MDRQMTRMEHINSWFSRLWAALVLPGDEVKEQGHRRQASLVAGIALLLAVLSVLGTIGSIAANGLVTFGSYLQITLAAVSIPAYFLGRSRRYMVGAWLLVIVLFFLGYADAFGSETPEQAVLYYAPFAFVMAVGLFSWRQLTVLTVIAAGTAMFLPMFGPQFSMVVVMTIFGLLISVGSLAIAVVSVRDAVEDAHHKELKSMNAQMQEITNQMEQRVHERTLDLSLAAEVGRRISALQDLGVLLETSVQLIADRFQLYYTQIYLVDRTGRSLILRAGTGEVGKELLRLNHRLPIDLSSINGSAALERRPVIVSDTAHSPTFRPHPLLPQTRSELAIPLISGDRVLGVLDLQSSTPGALSESELPVFDTLAAQLATALVNAELFDRVERSYKEMEMRGRSAVRQGWDEYLDAIEQKDRIAYAFDLLETTPLADPIEPVQDDCGMYVPIKIAGEPVGALQLAGESAWLPADREIADQVASLVAQRIENLRLLQQADRFRREAEATLRRLTHEEWDTFLAEDRGEMAFQYMDGLVVPAEQNGNGNHPALAFDIKVQNEPVGAIALEGIEQLPTEDAELAETVSSVLGSHLENLRLYSTAQQELVVRQRAEQALKDSITQIQESERLTRTVIDSTPDWIFIQDRNHRYRLVNQGYATSRHILPEDFIGKDDIELGYPEHVVKGSPEMGIRGIWPDNNVVFQTGEPHYLPNEPVMVDGAMHLFSMLKTPLRDAQGEVIGILVYARDVTERESILQQTARLYSASRRFADAHSLDDVVATVCESLSLPDFNRAALMLFEMDEQGSLVSTSVAANWHNGNGIPPFPVGLRLTDPTVLETFSGLIAREPIFKEETDEGARQEGVVSGVSMPLWIGDRFLGLITLQSEVEHRFTEEEKQSAAALSQQAAVAVESRLLFQETIDSEARFRETSKQLASALDAAKMANWEFDVASGEFIFNDTFYRYLRTTAEEMGGYRVPAPVYASRFVHPDDGAEMGASMAVALNTPDPNFTQELSSRTILADGEIRWTVVRIAIEKDAEGRTVRIIGANQDVTEQHLAEVETQQLLERTLASETLFRETSNQLSEALRVSRMGNWELDLETLMFTFNDEFYAMLRTTAEAEGGYQMHVSTYAQKFAHPDDASLVAEETRKAIETTDPNYTSNVVHRFYYADGTMGYLRVMITVVKDENGKTIKTRGANQDITEQHLASEQIESQRRVLQAVLDNMPVAVLAKDAKTYEFVMWNKAAERLFGIPSDAVIGKTDFDFYPIEQAEAFRAADAEVLEKRSLVDVPEEKATGSDGQVRILHTVKAPVVDEDNQPVLLLVVTEDITEARKTQELIAKRATELARVAEVATTVATIQSPDEMLQTVVDLTQQAFDLYHAHVYLLDENNKRLVLTKGAGEVGRKMVAEGRSLSLDIEKSLVARAARTRSGVIVNDVRLDPDFLSNPLLPDTRSEMAVPMIAGDRLLGVLDIQDEVIERFSHEDANIMTTLAAQVAVSLQNARSYARAQRQAEREALINAISERIQATNSVENALQVAVREIGRALGAQHTAVRLGLERKSEDAS